MIENVKQDQFNEQSPAFESALWIENYNPNAQRDSLIMRSEESNLYHIIQGSNILDATQYSGLVNHSVTNYPTNFSDYEDAREILICSNQYMQVTQPFYNDNYVVFMRRFSNAGYGADFSPHAGVSMEATAVVGWVPYIGSGGAEFTGWREPFHDSEEFPGWYVLGTFQDVARYGESLVFVTRPLLDLATSGNPGTYSIPEAYHTKLYPVYVWQWMDFSKKRSGINGGQKFWNGLKNADGTPIDLTLPKYRLWRVRRPSLSIAKGGLVEALALYQHPNTWKTMSGSDPTSVPVQLLFWESPLQTYAGFPNQTEYDAKFAAIEDSDDWELTKLYQNPFFADKSISFSESLELLDVDSLYQYGFDSVNRRILQTGEHQGIFQNGQDAVAFPKKESDGQVADTPAWDIKQYFVFRHGNVIVDIGGKDRPMRMLYMLTENRAPIGGHDNHNLVGDLTSVETKLYDPYADEDSYIHNRQSDASIGRVMNSVVVGTRMPNYLEAKIPRQWVQSEEVPFVLTAVVNGVEVVVLKDIYKIASHNYAFTESLFNPFYWDYIWNDMQGLRDIKYRGVSVGALATVSQTNFMNSIRLYTPPLSTYGQKAGGYYMGADVRYQQYTEMLPTVRNMKINGQYVCIPYYAGVYHSQGTSLFSYVQNRAIPYLYEPFNPTGEFAKGNSVIGQQYRLNNPHPLLHRDTTSDPWSTNPRNSAENYMQNIATDNRFGFYIPEHCEGNMLHFGLRIQEGFWDELSSMGISAFKLYVSKPDLQSSILRSLGLISVKEVPNGYYCKPKVSRDNNKDFSNYALVKTFLIEGEGTSVTNWDAYAGLPIATNAWKRQSGYIWAVPQDASGDARTSLPTFVDHNTDHSPALTSNHWTPDFILWDYPTKGPDLSLNSDGNYWDGIGARLVAVIKGRTFIGGCIDANGKEDVALVRYSDVQAGVAAQDIFTERNKVRIGHNAHTAFVTYREQLMFFSRYDNYRLQMPNVYDESTWEWLDGVGMGTFSQKTVCECPYGIIYCNESGIWITDGRLPKNLAVPILASYQRLIREEDLGDGQPDYLTQVAFLGEYTDKDGNPLYVKTSNSGINEYMECTYNYLHDEVCISSPMWKRDMSNSGRWIPVREFRLIYNFANENWRVESYDLPQTEVV